MESGPCGGGTGSPREGRGGNGSRACYVMDPLLGAFTQVILSNPLWSEKLSDLPRVTQPASGRARQDYDQECTCCFFGVQGKHRTL